MISLIIIVGVLIVTIYLYFTWNNNYWARKNVPFEPPLFFFGSIKDILNGSKHFGVHYMDMYNKFKNATYFGFYKARQPALIIKDLDLIKDIVVKDFSSFSSNDFQVDSDADPIWAQNLFSLNGDPWKKHRGAWSAALTASKLKSMYDMIHKKCACMIDYIKRESKDHPNKPLETRELTSNFFTDSILLTILGIDFDSFIAKDNPYKKITQSLFNSTIFDGMIMLSFMIFPGLAKNLKFSFVPKRVQRELITMSKKIIQQRQEMGCQKNNPFDVILSYGDNATRGVSEVEVAGTLFSFLLDGTETSAGVMAYMLYELSKNPDIQSKLRMEIDEAYESCDGQIIPYDKIHSLQYLDQVISETMRLYPPVLSIQRLCTKPYQLPPTNGNGKSLNLPIGMPVIIPVYAIHMDPTYYPNPEKFDPERFSEENKKSIPKYAFLPFSEGPRICIGFRLALNQTKVGIFNILRNFEVRLAPEMKDRELTIDPGVFVMKPINDLWVTFHERIDRK